MILKALESEVFISVEMLAKRLYTSPSSIRRDLATLENYGLAHRTHGGVTASNPLDKVASFARRMTQNVQGKHAVAKKAATLVQDGMNIILDGSTTASFLIPYLTKYKELTLFTNNLETALQAISNGIKTHCFGGRCFNGSPVLIGGDTERSIRNLHADVLFFSTQSLDKRGIISDSCEEETHVRQLMLEQADKKVFLCDKEKINRVSLYTVTSLSNVDACVLEQAWTDLDCPCELLY